MQVKLRTDVFQEAAKGLSMEDALAEVVVGLVAGLVAELTGPEDVLGGAGVVALTAELVDPGDCLPASMNAMTLNWICMSQPFRYRKHDWPPGSRARAEKRDLFSQTRGGPCDALKRVLRRWAESSTGQHTRKRWLDFDNITH